MSMASPCFKPSGPLRDLARLQSLPLDMKIAYTKARITEFYVMEGGNVYVSYSGGKDSTVLLDLVRSMYPEVPAVFVDTGLEFPELREHVKRTDNVVWLKPESSFRKVIMENGYPVVGKEVSKAVEQARKGNPNGISRMNGNGRYGYRRYAYLLDAPFKISGKCCDILKKAPTRAYHRETGRCPIIGTRAGESRLRTQTFNEKGENRYDSRIPTSNPLSIWTEEDVWNYIRMRNLDYPDVYDRGWKGTGCIFCCFGITQDPERFLRLKASHPQLWAYCMKPMDEGGLGMRDVLDFMHIPTGCDQCNLIEFEEARS